jgi:hypothetical protein
LSVEKIDNFTNNLVGRMLGRLVCGGELHYDAAQRDWQQPQQLVISLGGEEVFTAVVTGFEIRRDQAQHQTTRIALTATEP